MSEKDQYRVDLSELDGVVKRLKRLDKQMDGPAEKAKYGVTIPKGALGSNFIESTDLSSAHDEMEAYMDKTVTRLQKFISDFGLKADQTHGAYSDAEHDNAPKGQVEM